MALRARQHAAGGQRVSRNAVKPFTASRRAPVARAAEEETPDAAPEAAEASTTAIDTESFTFNYNE